MNQAGAMDQRWTFSHRAKQCGIPPARVRSSFLRSALHILALKMLNFSTSSLGAKIKDKSQYWFLSGSVVNNMPTSGRPEFNLGQKAFSEKDSQPTAVFLAGEVPG